jgi:SAM-dependent methyltransferase
MALDLLRSIIGGRGSGGLSRAQYKEVWNRISTSEDAAKIAVANCLDEDIYRSSAEVTIGLLRHMTGINATDTILEIGAGVGRVGAALAPLCKEWIGADVSPNMVRHMKKRLSDLPNARPIEISGFDLAPVADRSVDLVYCTVVFMHLDEWERWAYIREGFRVLKPGGRMFVDNIDLTSDQGWKMFLDHCTIPPDKRQANISKTSTPQELETFFRRAGFSAIRHNRQDLWIMTAGIKPSA